MPRQNRVDPFGNIVAHLAYGMLMGNRGCLHNEHGKIMRTTARDAWITCLPRWPGVRRTLMAPGQYTELFFLDEATAMAAGHRPCGSCRPEGLLAFKHAWRHAYDLPYIPLVPEMDAALRAAASQKLKFLSNGVMIVNHGKPYLRWKDRWLPWSFVGYEAPVEFDSANLLTSITPIQMQQILKAGYIPLVHPSAAPSACRTNATEQVRFRTGNSPGHEV